MPSQFQDYWVVMAAAFAAIVWFIRLESKVMYLEKDHGENKENQLLKNKEFETKMDLLTQQLSAIAVSLAKIEGFLYSEKTKE